MGLIFFTQVVEPPKPNQNHDCHIIFENHAKSMGFLLIVWSKFSQVFIPFVWVDFEKDFLSKMKH